MSRFEHFESQLRERAELQALPDELAYSFPVPVAPGTVAVILYQLLGLPPAAPRVLPRHRVVTSYPDPHTLVLGAENSWRQMSAARDGTLGEVVIPQPFGSLAYREFCRQEAEFRELYGRVVETYLAGANASPGDAAVVLERLPAFGKAPLVPLLRSVAPDFFAYLDRLGAAARK
jgi:hypothetical protein